MWWWVEPMIYTGIVFLVIASILGCIIYQIGDSDSSWPFIVTCILLLPLVIGGIGATTYFLWSVLKHIWTPFI